MLFMSQWVVVWVGKSNHVVLEDSVEAEILMNCISDKPPFCATHKIRLCMSLDKTVVGYSSQKQHVEDLRSGVFPAESGEIP